MSARTSSLVWSTLGLMVVAAGPACSLLVANEEVVSQSDSGGSTGLGDGDGDGDGDGSGGEPAGDGDGDVPGVGGEPTGGGGSGSPTGGQDGSGGGVTTVTVECSGVVYACGDAIDNDGDLLTDSDDPECTSPCDNDESSFATGTAGETFQCNNLDCFWDGNSGGGDDGCSMDIECDPEDPAESRGCSYDPGPACEDPPSQGCVDACAPLAPNGCDCFGCCEYDGSNIYLHADGCDLGIAGTCPPCTPSTACINPCDDECEVCFGQTAADLPAHCTEPVCPTDVSSCANSGDCPQGNYCQTGCCVQPL